MFGPHNADAPTFEMDFVGDSWVLRAGPESGMAEIRVWKAASILYKQDHYYILIPREGEKNWPLLSRTPGNIGVVFHWFHAPVGGEERSYCEVELDRDIVEGVIEKYQVGVRFGLGPWIKEELLRSGTPVTGEGIEFQFSTGPAPDCYYLKNEKLGDLCFRLEGEAVCKLTRAERRTFKSKLKKGIFKLCTLQSGLSQDVPENVVFVFHVGKSTVVPNEIALYLVMDETLAGKAIECFNKELGVL